VSLAIWDHTVLPATRHKRTHLAVTPARLADTRFTYPGGMEGWVDLGDWLHTEIPRIDGLPAHRNWWSPIQVITPQRMVECVELATSWSQVWRPKLTTSLLSHHHHIGTKLYLAENQRSLPKCPDT